MPGQQVGPTVRYRRLLHILPRDNLSEKLAEKYLCRTKEQRFASDVKILGYWSMNRGTGPPSRTFSPELWHTSCRPLDSLCDVLRGVGSALIGRNEISRRR